jgi:hypothetical protein
VLTRGNIVSSVRQHLGGTDSRSFANYGAGTNEQAASQSFDVGLLRPVGIRPSVARVQSILLLSFRRNRLWRLLQVMEVTISRSGWQPR